MNPNENWIAEQARLIDLEDGFGPAYAPTRAAPADAEENIAARHAA
jgi:hypothetical protein